MCGKLDCYLKQFAFLKSEKDHSQWTENSRVSSPQKPLLLLSIFNHIASRTITRNFIEPTPHLEKRYQHYWEELFPDKPIQSMAKPFYDLDSESFWSLVPRSGQASDSGCSCISLHQLKERYLGARFSEDLFPLLVMETHRKKIEAVIVETCFSATLQKKIALV